MKTLVLVENGLQTCNIFDILIQTQETPRLITRSPIRWWTLLVLGFAYEFLAPLHSFGGIFAGSADYYSNFNHRSFCSTWVPTDAHDVGRSGRLYEYEVSVTRGTTHQLVEVR